MKLLITDTNVFIDMIDGGFCPNLFNLEYEIHTTQFVINELENDQQETIMKYYSDGKLIIKKYDFDEINDILELPVTRRSVSERIADRSVLHYAIQNNNRILISGDKSLKNEANDNNIEVHGSIWLISEMQKQRLYNAAETIEALEMLKRINPFLPAETITNLIKEVEKMKT